MEIGPDGHTSARRILAIPKPKENDVPISAKT